MNTPNGRRLVIAHNPHSSRATAVQEQVFDCLDKAGFTYEKIEVQQASLEDNVNLIAPQIKAGDVILSAAGDGSAHAVLNSVLIANQPDVELGFLAFGNFNDAPFIFTSKESMQDPVLFLEQAKPQTVWPLSVFVDEKPLRSALLYVSLGWTARAAHQFDNPSVRKQLIKGSAGIRKSILRLTRYYFRTRRDSLLPSFSYKNKSYKMTDVICANGPEVARLFRSGKDYYKSDTFLLRMLDVRQLVANIPFLVSGVIGRMKGEETTDAIVEFAAPSQVPLQCDGEVVELENVTRIEVRKASKPLVVLVTK